MSPFNCTQPSSTQFLWSVASKAVPLFHISPMTQTNFIKRSHNHEVYLPALFTDQNKDHFSVLVSRKVIWATSWQNQQNDMCAQRRLRSAWPSAESDQSFRCPHDETLGPQLPIERTAKTQIRLGGCPGWSESSLGAHVILMVLSCGGSYIVHYHPTCYIQSNETVLTIWINFSLIGTRRSHIHETSLIWRHQPAHRIDYTTFVTSPI